MKPSPQWEAVSFRQAHLTAVEQEALARAGYGGRSGLGLRPVLLVVDVTMAFCGPREAGLLEAVERYPHASGPAAWRAVSAVRSLTDAARAAGVPIVFTCPVAPGALSGLAPRWDDKNDRQQEAPPDAFGVVAETGFAETDLLVEKAAPSAFAGTPLTRWLTGLNCDSVIVCGGTTSGCVRATVVDAFSLNLRVTVASDACFDRVVVSHDVGLFDMDLKYADVLPAAEIIAGLPVRSTG